MNRASGFSLHQHLPPFYVDKQTSIQAFYISVPMSANSHQGLRLRVGDLALHQRLGQTSLPFQQTMEDQDTTVFADQVVIVKTTAR